MPDSNPATLVDFIRERVETWPEGRIRSRARNVRWETHAALWDRSARIAAGLVEIGATTGRPVVLLVRDVLDFVPVFWACLRCGAMAVPLSGAAALRRVDRSDATLTDALARLDRPVIVFDETFRKVIATLRHESEATLLTLAEAEAASPLLGDRPAAEPACLIPTSGSTGRLKLAALSEAVLLQRSLTFARVSQNATAMTLSLLPFDGVSGLHIALLPATNQFHLPIPTFAAEPLALLDLTEHYRVVVLPLTNSLIAILLKAAENADRRWDLSRLEVVSVGAEPIVPATMRRLRDLLQRHGASNITFKAAYGTTETGRLAYGANPLDALAGEPSPIGPCNSGVSLRIVGEDGAPLADGEIGIVQALRPGGMFSGYWGEPETTQAGYTEDGWWRTGDLGCFRDGVLTLHGRAKEIVVVNGKKQSLADIDAHLQVEFGLGSRAYSCAVRAPEDAGERLAVVFVDEDGRHDGTARTCDRIRTAIGHRFGLQAQAIGCSDPQLIPMTDNGKIRRSELARRVLAGFYRPTERVDVKTAPSSQPDPIASGLAAIWRETLDISGPLDPQANFFALGGDSLRAVRLSTRIEDTFGRQVAPEDFFAAPTLATLLRLVAEARGRPDDETVRSDAAVAWPLPEGLRHRQLSIVESWEGVRPTRDRLVVGLNTVGTRAPLFFVCQNGKEFRLLADQLGEDQPVYALRSGAELIAYTENEVQALALRYAEEIAEVCPDDTLFLCGICQGGVIALAIAQHLERRGRHIPLLILIEWSFALQSYGGKVLLLYGEDSRDHSRRRYRDPEAVWRHSFTDCESMTVPGGHFVMHPGSVNAVGDVIARALRDRQSVPPRLLRRAACRAELTAEAPPAQLRAGATASVDIRVHNRGRFAWHPQPLGLVLRNAWADADGTIVKLVDGSCVLPVVDAGASVTVSLPVAAPNVNGALSLIVGLIDEGSSWRGATGPGTLRFGVTVGDPFHAASGIRSSSLSSVIG